MVLNLGFYGANKNRTVGLYRATRCVDNCTADWTTRDTSVLEIKLAM